MNVEPDPAFVAGSSAMREVMALARRVAKKETTVLIEGPSGSGKERLARWIHLNSSRADAPFMAVSCSAIPETLMESELFGVKSGAFTGADRDRPGVMAEAQGGTLFLDEVGDIPIPMQIKLLRAIQEREIKPVGSSRPRHIDFRIMAAATVPLCNLVSQGLFREDFYYRLNVVTIKLPQLSKRTEDLPDLAEQILQRIAHETGEQPKSLSTAALERIKMHCWPGNIRELENALERAVVLTRGTHIKAEALPLDTGLAREHAKRPILPKGLTLHELEEIYIEQVLADCGGNRSEAARLLGVDRKTIYRKLKRS